MSSKIVNCVDCGKEYPRKELNRHFRCPECAMAKMRDVVKGMYYKTGPEYEHWKEKIKAATAKL